MGNLLCVLAHCSGRGEEIIAGDKSHIFLLEQGNIAQVSASLLEFARKVAGCIRYDVTQLRSRNVLIISEHVNMR